MIARFLPAIFMAIGVIGISGIRAQYLTPPRTPMKAMSPEIAGLRGGDLEISEVERQVAGMTDFALRSYGPASSPVFTTYVGYYDRQLQGKSIHSPKNCLPGAGWEILQSARVAFPEGREGETVNRVLLSNRGVQALVYYWYQGRGRVEASEYRVKWNLLRDAARWGRTEESLVRIVVPLNGARGLTGSEGAVRVAQADSLATKVAKALRTTVDHAMPLWSQGAPVGN